jgi:hypothetical protein
MPTDTKSYPYGSLRQTKLGAQTWRDREAGVMAFGDQALYDNRVRLPGGVVPGAPRKFKIKTDEEYADGGIEVSENYPFADTLKKKVLESNTHRLTRGIRQGTVSDASKDGEVSSDGGGHNATHTFFAGLPATAAFGPSIRNPIIAFPPEQASPEYPYNSVRSTESGHLFEADDTPGYERIKEAHRRGTFYEILPDGTKVTKIVRDNFSLVVGNDFVNVRGAAIVTVEGDCNLYTKGNLTQQVDGDYNLRIKGAYNMKCKEDVSVKVGGNYHETIDKSKNSDIKHDKKVDIGANESRTIGAGMMFGGALSVGFLGMGNRSVSVVGTENKKVRLKKSTFAVMHESDGMTFEKTAFFKDSSLTVLGNTTLSSGGFTTLIGDLGCNMESGVLMTKLDYDNPLGSKHGVARKPTSTISVTPFIASVNSKLITRVKGMLTEVNADNLLRLSGGIITIN